MDEYKERATRQFCSAHYVMVDHDEKTSDALARVETKLSGIYWLAGAMLLLGLGSIGAVISIGYYSGTITQSVKMNTVQVENLANKIDRHIERATK